MHHKLFSLVAFLFLVAHTGLTQPAADFTGTWEGTLDLGGTNLRVVFHIKDNGKGGLVTTADSPDQSAFGIPCDSTAASNNEVFIFMSALQANYAGKLVNDTTLDGVLTQAGTELALLLKKAGNLNKPSGRKRPQTPLAPFPYRSEDVTYDSKDNSVKLAATISIPDGKGPFPAVLLITGSGPQNRDEEIMGHKPFAVLADHLVRRGFVVLRADDRGIGKSTGNFATATSADFADDAGAGIDYLLTRPEVNKKRIGMMGHSEGGMIAPMVATARKDIDFVVLLAAPGVKITELMAEQNAAIMRSSDMSQEAVSAYLQFYKEVIGAMLQSTDTTAAYEAGKKVLKSWESKTPDKLVIQLGIKDSAVQHKMLSAMAQQVTTPWFRYFLNFDPQPYLQKLKAKVLALNGSKDIQVISSQNLQGIDQALKKAKPKAYEIKELPGLNHLFQTCEKCTVSEYAELEETFSPLALDYIGNWLDKNVK